MNTFWFTEISEGKFLHFLIYCLISLAFASTTFLFLKKKRLLLHFMTIGFTLSFIAILEEYRQFPIVGRSTELMDAVFSIAGIWTGIILLMLPCLFIYKIRVKKAFIPAAFMFVIWAPLLFGLTWVEERPMGVTQNSDEDASVPVFAQPKGEGSTVSLKAELEKIAFEQDPDESFRAGSKYKTADEILATYEAYFNKLKLYASIQSDLLFEEAVTEYKNRKEDESFSIIKYLKKYKESGINLSGNIDEMFEAIYKKLEAELKANGHDPELAEPFKKKYEKEKRTRVTTILKFIKDELL